MDPITIALGLAKYVPDILGYITGSSKTKDNAEKIVAIANTVAGVTPDGAYTPEQLGDILQANGKLAEFKSQLDLARLNGELELARIDSTNLQAVNMTMQAEGKSEHWLQWSWRPLLGISLTGYITAFWVLPLFDKVVPILPPELIVAIGAILGVASWGRNLLKQQKVAAVTATNSGE
jgi:hypothetical protein